MTSTDWNIKYTPHQLDDIYLNEAIKQKFSKMIFEQNVSNMIFCGPPGTGKTISAYVIAKHLYKQYYKDLVYEINLLEDHRVKTLYDDLLMFGKIKMAYTQQDANNFPPYKLIIIDGIDTIIPRLQEQIGILMNSNYGENVRFIVTCNFDINEIIQSNSLNFKFDLLPETFIYNKLKHICISENINYDDQGLMKIAERSQGDMRGGTNLLQLVYTRFENITEQNVCTICLIPQSDIINQLFKHILQKSIEETFKLTENLLQCSFSGSDITQSMLTIIKSPSCIIDDKIKIKLQKCICNGIYNIAKVSDSKLQIYGIIADMFISLNVV